MTSETLTKPESPPEAWAAAHRALRSAVRPLERFLHVEAASGLVLIAAAVFALAWANSPWAASYERVFHLPLGVRLGPFAFERPLHWVVNDGLMTIFFFVVGLEIRREIHHGELSELRRAALPVAAALGGMIVPALLYGSVASSGAEARGWGVPMATDIAFAIGVLTLLGKRVPAALRVLLLALAVIDDLGAIVVIALFYSGGISLTGVCVFALGLVMIAVLKRFGVRARLAYVPPAFVAWAGAYAAGVHPTLAGVVVGLMTPVRAWLGRTGFVAQLEHHLQEGARVAEEPDFTPQKLVPVLKGVSHAKREALSPSSALIEQLHPWVAFAIMPLFALANAGVPLAGVSLSGAPLRVTLGAALGLFLGKPLGVVLASLLAVRLNVALLPRGIGFTHLAVLGLTAGIGFTMALFVAQLAFSDAALLSAAKLAVLVASAAAAVAALGVGSVLLPSVPRDAAQTADEAEASTYR